jgi:ABC-type dipeptide/oligopeptide/nickel transport system permease component
MNARPGKQSRFAGILKHLLSLILTLLAAGFLGAVLLHFSPGSDIDDLAWDPHYSAEARARMREERAGERNVAVFYFHYLERAAHGDLGVSRSLAAPVSELIAARAGVTARLIGWGLAIGWMLGLGLAVMSVAWPGPAITVVSETLCGLSLSLPAAVVALLIFLSNGPVPLVIGVAIFPRVFRFSRDLFVKALNRPQVLAARARGIAERWILLRYVARPAWAPLVALAGVCVSLAFGAVIPVEALCDLPGLGQLAWKAATDRDLTLLVGLTLLVTTVTLTANAAADIVLESSRA